MGRPESPPPVQTTVDFAAEVEKARAAARDYERALQDGHGTERRRHFERDMVGEGLQYGRDRLLCTTLRPHFITAAVEDAVARAMRLVVRALQRLGRLSLTDETLQDAVAMTPAEKEMAAIHPRTDDISALSRMDAFVSGAGLHLVEYNAECPTGVGYNERLFRVFERLDAFSAFASRYPVRVTDGVEDVLQTLLERYRAWGGQGTPRIAIVDWREVVTRGEFEIFAEHFSKRGVETVLADPRDLEMVGGRLMAEGGPVDLVYRRLLVGEFLQRREECPAFEKAYREQAACFVNNLRTKILHKKLAFAMLWDERFQRALDAEERAAIRAHVPWTHRLGPGPMVRDGVAHDPGEYAVTHRETLVLKPNDDYGGRGLVLGAETSEGAWVSAIVDALKGAEDPARVQVIQERIPLHQEDFPDLDGEMRRFYVDLDPFFFGDRMHGFLTRVSTKSVSNVTSGGGQIPTYVLA